MNEFDLIDLDLLINTIEKQGEYIDCPLSSSFKDNDEYESIMYYLKNYNNLQSKTDKAIKYINNCEEELLPASPLWITELRNILKEDK